MEKSSKLRVRFQHTFHKTNFYECPDCGILNPSKSCQHCFEDLSDKTIKVAYKAKSAEIRWE